MGWCLPNSCAKFFVLRFRRCISRFFPHVPTLTGHFCYGHVFGTFIPNRWFPKHTTPTTNRARKPAAVSLALRWFGGSKGIASVLPIPGTPSGEVRGGEGSRMDPWPWQVFFWRGGGGFFWSSVIKKKAMIIWTDFTYICVFSFLICILIYWFIVVFVCTMYIMCSVLTSGRHTYPRLRQWIHLCVCENSEPLLHPLMSSYNSTNFQAPGDSKWPFWDGDLWSFSKVKWPPTRGSKGHLESPGRCCGFKDDISLRHKTTWWSSTQSIMKNMLVTWNHFPKDG